MRRKHLRNLVIVLTLASLFRIAYALLVWTPLFISPNAMPSTVRYLTSAYALAAGVGYSQALPGSDARRDLYRLMVDAHNGKTITPGTSGPISSNGLYREILRPPGWSLVGALLHRVFEVPVWMAMQATAITLDVIACGLLYWLILLCLQSHSIALIASIAYALFPPLGYACANLEATAPMSFFMILATVFVVLAVQLSNRKMYIYYALCGLTIGLSAYFRPDYLLVGPFFFLGLLAYTKNFWRSFAHSIVILAVSLLVLFPWAYRNHGISGRWIFTSSSAGATLITGLGAYPNPWGFGHSDQDRAREAKAQGISSPWSPEADIYFRKIFVRSVKQHPWAYMKTVVRRSLQVIATPYAWGFKLKAKTQSLTELRHRGKLSSSIGYVVRAYWPRLIMASIMLASLICTIFMLIRERRRHPILLFPVLVPFYAALSHLFTYMAPYYLLPGAFGLLIGLAYIISLKWGKNMHGLLRQPA